MLSGVEYRGCESGLVAEALEELLMGDIGLGVIEDWVG